MRFAVVVPLALAVAVPTPALAGTSGPAAPCTLIGTKTASAYLDSPAKEYPERAHDGTRLCLYIASTGRLQVEDGSRSNWASASLATSPPGTVIVAKPGLGENGNLVYDKKPKYRFALAAFERGPYYYSVYSQQLSPSQVLSLARLVHRKVAG